MPSSSVHFSSVYFSKTSWNCLVPLLTFIRFHSKFSDFVLVMLLYIFGKKVIFSMFSNSVYHIYSVVR